MWLTSTISCEGVGDMILLMTSDWGQEEKGTTEGEMAGWHHRLNGLEFEWTPGVGDGQGGLACCSSWGCKESDTTEWLNWTQDWFWYSVFLSLWTVCACCTIQTGLGFSWFGSLDAGKSVMLAFFFLLVLSVLPEDFSNISRHLLMVSLLEGLYQSIHFLTLYNRFYFTTLFFLTIF